MIHSNKEMLDTTDAILENLRSISVQLVQLGLSGTDKPYVRKSVLNSVIIIDDVCGVLFRNVADYYYWKDKKNE